MKKLISVLVIGVVGVFLTGCCGVGFKAKAEAGFSLGGCCHHSCHHGVGVGAGVSAGVGSSCCAQCGGYHEQECGYGPPRRYERSAPGLTLQGNVYNFAPPGARLIHRHHGPGGVTEQVCPGPGCTDASHQPGSPPIHR